MKKIILFLMASIFIICAFLTSCTNISDSSATYTVFNSSSSDAYVIADKLGAEYHQIDFSDAVPELAGVSILVSTSENGLPFDFTGFNDDGYIVRKIDDDIIICGKNADATQQAVDYFVESHISEGEIVFASNLDYVHGSAGRLGKVTLGGVDIEEYKIVIPAEATVFEKYAAEILRDHLYDAGGITVGITDDSSEKGEHEIIIGNTSRAETPNEREYGTMEYYFGVDGTDIVLDGTDFMVGGGVGKLIADYLEPEDCGDVSLDSFGDGAVYTYEPREAESAILVLCHGLGRYTAKFAQQEDENFGVFYPDLLPNKGELATLMYWFDGTPTADNMVISHTGPAATAFACGYKTQILCVGSDWYGNPIKNVREVADEAGVRTAVVTGNEGLLNTSTSAFLAHVSDRYDYDGIKEWHTKINVDYARGGITDPVDGTRKALSAVAENGEPFFLTAVEIGVDSGAHFLDTSATIEGLDRINRLSEYVITYAVCHTNVALIMAGDVDCGGIIRSRGKYVFHPDLNGDHSQANTPVYAIGGGTEFFNQTLKENVLIATFIADIFGNDHFGHLGWTNCECGYFNEAE